MLSRIYGDAATAHKQEEYMLGRGADHWFHLHHTNPSTICGKKVLVGQIQITSNATELLGILSTVVKQRTLQQAAGYSFKNQYAIEANIEKAELCRILDRALSGRRPLV